MGPIPTQYFNCFRPIGGLLLKKLPLIWMLSTVLLTWQGCVSGPEALSPEESDEVQRTVSEWVIAMNERSQDELIVLQASEVDFLGASVGSEEVIHRWYELRSRFEKVDFELDESEMRVDSVGVREAWVWIKLQGKPYGTEAAPATEMMRIGLRRTKPMRIFMVSADLERLGTSLRQDSHD